MVRRRIGISLMEVILVAGAAATLSTVGFTAIRQFTGNVKLHEAQGMLSKIRAGIQLYRLRNHYFPASIGTSYTYNYNNVTYTAYYYDTNAIPAEPYKNSSTRYNVAAATTQPAAITELGANGGIGGWIYNPNTGQFWINLRDSEIGIGGSNLNVTENPSSW